MEISNLIHVLGWTLVNSLWQAILISLLLGISLLFIKPKYSKMRSMLAYASLLLIFAASIRTFSNLSSITNFSQKEQISVNNFTKSDLVIFYDNQKALTENSISNSKPFPQNKIGEISDFLHQNLSYIVGIWFVGIILLSFRMIGGYLYLNKIKNNNIFPVDKKWEKILQRISNKLEIKRKIKFFESAIVKFPTVIGFLKPVILMPIGMLTEIPYNQIEIILAHEIAHIKRSDYLLNLIQTFLEIIYFFNPAVWIISKIIRNEREYACDDTALEIIGENKNIDFAKALINFKENRINKPAVAISVIGTKNSLFRRIKRMLSKNNTSINYPKRFGIATILVASLVIVTTLACSTSSESFNQNKATAGFVNLNDNQTINNNEPFSNQSQTGEFVNENEKKDSYEKNWSTETNNGVRNFKFYKDDVQWKGKVKDGKLLELYKDGEKVPQAEFGKYENFVLDTLDEIDEAMVDLNINMEELKSNLHHLKEELKDLKVNIDTDVIEKEFKSQEFKNQMAELKKSLKEIKFEFNDQFREELKKAFKDSIDFNFQHFKSEEFKKEMQNVKEELKKLKDVKVDFDNESFQKSMKELQYNMQNLKIKMDDLNIDLSDLKVDLSDMKIELKKLKNFVNYLREDLADEGYLSNKNEDFDFRLNKNEAIFENQKLPNKLHQKYLQKYKDIFGKELEDEFRINN